MRKSIPIQIALPVIILFVATALPASGAESLLPDILRGDHPELRPNQRLIVDIDRDLIVQLIKLARFNIHFHQETNRHWAWRGWLYPMAQEAGTAASFANTLVDLRERARGLKDPALISSSDQRRGIRCAMVGNAISGGASAGELTQNLIVVSMARRRGFSPRDSVAFVKNHLQSIDALLEQRQQIVSATRPGSVQDRNEMEGQMLRHIRNLLVLEFKRWSAASREVMWRENTFYTIDSAQNFTSFASALVSNKAFNAPTLKGSAAICALAANSMATLNPIIKNTVGKCMVKYQRWHLSRVFPESRPGPAKDLLAAWATLEESAAKNQPGATESLQIKEAAFMARNVERGERVISKEQKQMEKLRQVADQQAISGPIIGMASVARSLLATISYYGYRSESSVSNKIAFAGRISQTCGQSYSLLNTPTTKIMEVIYTHRLKKRGELPSQILAQRLSRLDRLEKEAEEARDRAPGVSFIEDKSGTVKD